MEKRKCWKKWYLPPPRILGRFLALAAAFCLLIPLAPPADAAPAGPPPPPTSAGPATTGGAASVALTALSSEKVLTVAFDDNQSGGMSLTNNPMKSAIDNALAAQNLAIDQVDRLVLTGNATEITKYNWDYLRNICFGRPSSPSSDRLRVLELTGMPSLTRIAASVGFSDTPNPYPQGTPRKVLLPDSLIEIGSNAFKGCSSLDLEIPPSVTKIGDQAFWKCLMFNPSGLPDSLTTIGLQAFGHCEAITRIEIPNSVASIGMSAFQESGLTELTFEDGVTKIDQLAFMSCDKLEKVVFPSTLETIGVQAFHECALKELVLPKSLTQIDAHAFTNNSLEAVYFEGGAPALGLGVGDIFGTSPMVGYIDFTLPSELLLFAPETGQASYGDSAWDAARTANKLHYYPDPAQLRGALQLKYGFTNDAYESLGFELLRPSSQSAAPVGTVGALQLDPADWEVYGLESGRLLASGGWSPLEPRVGVVTLNPRWWGNIRLRASFHLQIYYDNGDPATAGWRDFPFGGVVSLEDIPPAPPGKAAYQLSATNGEGGGWYRADDKIPLKARPPYPGAEFLRWELKSGTGIFDDPAQPETFFTMAVGNSAVEAVFAPRPNPAEHPTPVPATGDSALPLAAALSLLAGAGLLLALRRGVRRR